MAELVLLDQPAGPTFVAALQRIWGRGAAVFVIDSRLRKAEKSAALGAAAPTHVFDNGEIVALTRDPYANKAHHGRAVLPGDALVLCTSGTTGVPKAVVLTHEAIRASAEMTSRALGVDSKSDIWLCCLPVGHIGGLSVILRALLTGCGLQVLDRFDPQLVDEAAKGGATRVSLVTRALNQIETSRWDTILLGGAAPPKNPPSNCVITWGMTETGSGCVYDYYPLNGVQLAVRTGGSSGSASQEQTRHLGIQTVGVGELLVKSPTLLRAYRNANGDIDPFNSQGFFPTGDIGRLNADGRLQILGREDDVITSGGEKVWPAPIEAALRQLNWVGEVCVIGRPDADWGHRVVAVVQPKPEVLLPTETAGLEQAKHAVVTAGLSSWNQPKELIFVKQLPRTTLGKVSRKTVAKGVVECEK